MERNLGMDHCAAELISRRLRAGFIALMLAQASVAPAQEAKPPELPPATPIASRAIATLKIPGAPDFLAADDETVWVTNEGRVEHLRADRPQPIASVPLPGACGAPIIANRSLWVADCKEGALVRIDLRSGRTLAAIRTGIADPEGELSLASGAGSIWLLSDARGLLSRIDPQLNQMVAKITVEPGSFAVAFGFGAVWVTNTEAGSVQRVSHANLSVANTIPVGPTPRFLAVGEDAVWVLNQGDGTVSRIDPEENAVVARIPVGATGPGGDIAVGAGRVWVRATNLLLAAIDPRTNKVVETFGPNAGSGAVRVADGVVWVTAHDIQTVWAIKARP